MNRRPTILLVEDNDIDVEAARRTLRRQRIDNPVVVARDGEEALRRLRGHCGSEPINEPYLILLDLNMPRMSGLEFLAELRADPEHQQATVYVLTTSDLDDDRVAAESLDISGYIVKHDLEKFLEVVKEELD